MTKLVFWYDFASTYSYLSAMRIEALAKNAGVEMEWRPFLLGPIFKAQGLTSSPFNAFPAKGRYMWRDMKRLTDAAHLPFNWPAAFQGYDQFPRRSILAARVALVGAHAGWCPDFTRRVFTAEFGEGLDIAHSKTMAGILENMGLDANEVMQQAANPEIKDKLRANTEAAEALELFGAPSFTVGSELYWGNDRLEEALAFAASA